jgi:hypothetical protein
MGWDNYRFVARTKHDKEIKRRERKVAKAERKAARRGMADHTTGHLSADDPTLGMSRRQPPVLGSVARILAAAAE